AKVTLAQLQRSSGECCASFMQVLIKHIDSVQQHLTPSDWVEQIKARLNEWGWPGERVLTSLEYQVVKRFYELLTEFAGLDDIKGPIAYPVACQLLWQQAKSILFQGESEDKPIQILGHLEAVGIHFHALWVTGLHHENWPMPCDPHPFLPARLQRSHDMPHATPEREYAFAENLTLSFTSQAKQVVLSFPEQIEDKKLIASALLTPYQNQVLPPYEVALAVHLPDELEYWSDVSVPFVAKNERLRGGIALLQAQANCPFQAFARYRLYAQELTVPESGFNALHRGQVLHAALDYFWQAVCSQKQLLSLTAQEYTQQVDAAVTKALAVLQDLSFTRTQLNIEKCRVSALVDEFITHERTRADFTVIAREQAITLELSSLKLNARIDRIDQLANNQKLLIDYKTGRVDEPQWLEDLSHVQLPLYALSIPDVQGVAFAQVKANAMKWIGISADKDAMPQLKAVDELTNTMQWSELLHHWQGSLTALADEFYRGAAEVLPLAGDHTCRHCHLELLCRIRSRS
ncbi:MAG TPA: PD-(D/E)XK nuclease family protein, partial [Gammaproteobacteria bacterium]|nr:PD-(D/E)XK nuclease family protein [Gammaproteobacteria bacterium]